MWLHRWLPSHGKTLIAVCKTAVLKTQFEPEDVFELDLSFAYLKAKDMSLVHKALLHCVKLVGYGDSPSASQSCRSHVGPFG